MNLDQIHGNFVKNNSSNVLELKKILSFYKITPVNLLCRGLGQVVEGSTAAADVSDSSVLNVNQASDRVIIDWDSFGMVRCNGGKIDIIDGGSFNG